MYEISLNKLLGKSERQPTKNLKYKASIFDRNAVDDIARKYFDFSRQLSDPERQLLTEITYHFGTMYSDAQRWEGIHIDQQPQLLIADKDGFLRDKSFCTVELPDRAMEEEALFYPNPNFRLTLTNDFEGRQISRNKWIIETGVSSLEDHLFHPVTE